MGGPEPMRRSARPDLLVKAVRGFIDAFVPVRRSRYRDVQRRDLSIPGPEKAIDCRLYLPPDQPTSSGELTVFVHGGGFISCSLDTHDEICRTLSAHSGIRVLSVGYTLAPEAPVDGQLREVLAVCRRALDGPAGDLGGAATSLALAGDSSGAYLAVLAGVALNREREGLVRAQLLLYPLVHLEDRRWARPRAGHLRYVGRIAGWVIRRSLASPVPSLLSVDMGPAPPTIMVSGGFDPTHPDAAPLVAHLRAFGGEVEEVGAPVLPHGAFHAAHLYPPAHRALRDAAVRLARRLRPPGLVS